MQFIMHCVIANRVTTKSVLKLFKFSIFQTTVQNLGSRTTRCLCSKPLKDGAFQDSRESNKVLEWTPIYYFPFIKIARLLNRLKLYQSLVTVSAFPISIGLYHYGLCDIPFLTVVTGSAVFTCLTLYIFTSFFKRLIGVIYIAEDKKYVKIAHLTFWGNRKDIIVLTEDIVPLTDGSCKGNDVFIKLHRYNCKEVLYMTLRFGRILNKDTFQDIFGSLEFLGLKK